MKGRHLATRKTNPDHRAPAIFERLHILGCWTNGVGYEVPIRENTLGVAWLRNGLLHDSRIICQSFKREEAKRKTAVLQQVLDHLRDM